MSEVHKLTQAVDADAAYVQFKLAEAEREDAAADKDESSAAGHRQRAREARLEAGKRLIEVRSRYLPAGQTSVRPGGHLPGWYSWLDANGIARETARNLIRDVEPEAHAKHRTKDATRKREQRAKAPKTAWGWIGALMAFAPDLRKQWGGQQKQAMAGKLGFSLDGKLNEAQARELAQLARTLYAAPPKREEFTESQQAKIARAVKRESAAELAKLRKSYWEEVSAQVVKGTKAAREHYEQEIQEAQSAKESYEVRTRGLVMFMTEEEYRLLLNCLHPDRAPEDRRERFTKAFAILQRLGRCFD